MADTALQLGIVGAYMIIALAVGAVAYRLTDRTAEDYYLASRTLGTVVLLFTTFATLLSAFTFFGGPNLAFSAGPEWILVMGLMDGIIFAVLWYVLGYKQWLVGKRHGYVTLGEMLGDRFGSTALRVVVAGVSLVWLFPYVMLQQKGAGQAIVGLTNGAVPFWVGAGGITLFMIAYVALSGMRGVAWTDTLQGLFMLSLIWVAVAWVLSAVGGASEATALLASKEPAFVGLGGGLYTPQYIISTAVSIAFGVTMFPQINQRFFAAGSKKVLKRTFALWPVLVLLLFVPAFMLGAWAAGLGVTVPEGGNVIPALLGEYTPTWFTALVIAGAMAAMMSSSDSMLLSGSSYLTRDLYRPLTGRSNASDEATDRREALVARVGVIVFATLSFVVSLYSPGTLVQIGETAFSGFAQLTLPVALALYWQGTTRTGMYAGVIGSQVFYGLHVFPVLSTLGGLVGISVALPTAYLGWTPGIVGIIVGLVLTVGVSLVTAPAATENHTVYAVSGVESD
ncbi:sodium:solute symporter [Haloarcula sp. Atlit-7R]|uniref:sodium:solute symporter family protein n=1 Tax=Haloarcula sp. Atlit-7R TaxID=2282125 RepID=UPI000EF169B3|nr:sodium:solute symporter family protein [Haloarcula sp. Atlit-7R]RLM97451.1 sodium:solute symporter family protein [Haloarcula sp. Atlit-7R]